VERRQLESTAANYPYLQGLWALPLGVVIIVTAISNLRDWPSGPALAAIVLGGIAVAAVLAQLIGRHYRGHYGSVIPTRDRSLRQAVAIGAWAAVLFVGGNGLLFWTPDGRQGIFASAFALATLVYYAILVGLRPHHVAIWGGVFVAGLLPAWGGFGADRDALLMIPLGFALMASGLLDQRLLARSFRSMVGSQVEVDHRGR
jgi:hypothetical protein